MINACFRAACTADRFRACPFKTVTPGGCSRFCCWQQTALSSAQLSSARTSSARHALHFAPTRNCWDHHRENLLCYERIILFMSGLNIVKTRFSLLLLEQLQHERGIFLERSVCWECVSSGWFSGAVLLLLRLRTVVTPLSSWLSGSDFKVPVLGCFFFFLENLTRLRAPSWGSRLGFYLVLMPSGLISVTVWQERAKCPIPEDPTPGKCGDELWKSSLCDFFSHHLCVR